MCTGDGPQEKIAFHGRIGGNGPGDGQFRANVRVDVDSTDNIIYYFQWYCSCGRYQLYSLLNVMRMFKAM